jgi:hypothetical protein
MTEVEKLTERLFGRGAPKLLNFHVDFGGHKFASVEEVAKHINAFMDAPATLLDFEDSQRVK